MVYNICCLIMVCFLSYKLRYCEVIIVLVLLYQVQSLFFFKSITDIVNQLFEKELVRHTLILSVVLID